MERKTAQPSGIPTCPSSPGETKTQLVQDEEGKMDSGHGPEQIQRNKLQQVVIRRQRRGKRVSDYKKRPTSVQWSIYHVNIRGFTSKKISLNSIVNIVRPDVITLNETHLKNNKQVKIPGYNSYSRNRQQQCSGGISTSVANKDSVDCLKVTEGSEDNEFIVTRHGQFATPVNVINIYGEQESRISCDKIQDKWENIMKEVVKI